MTSPVLAHYDPALPMKMAGDASAYGIGAVISHVFPDGSERPIAFASRTLSTSEHRKGGPVPGVWYSEVSPVPIWPLIHPGDGP